MTQPGCGFFEIAADFSSINATFYCHEVVFPLSQHFLPSQIRNSAEIPEVLLLSSHPNSSGSVFRAQHLSLPLSPSQNCPKTPPISCRAQDSRLFLCNYLILSLNGLSESESIRSELMKPRLVINPSPAGDVSAQPERVLLSKPSSSRAGPTSSPPAQFPAED